MNYPVIDERNKEAIIEQAKALAASYVPEWNFPQQGNDVGETMVSVFAHMFADTIAAMNKLPYKNYLSFLNFIGLKLLAGSAAEGYVTVILNEGAEPGVHIKKGTQLYLDKGEGVGQVLYETQNHIFAIDNSITHVFCVNSFLHSIVSPYHHAANSNAAYRLFDFVGYDNLQKHILYLSSSDILNISPGAKVEIEINNRVRRHQEAEMAGSLANRDIFTWHALTDKGWNPIEGVSQVGNRVVLSMEHLVPMQSYGSQEGRWIKCQANPAHGPVDIMVDSLQICAKSDAVEPDFLINNDMQLTRTNFLPFGEHFAIYDDFYLGSQEALTKKGAQVNLTFNLAFKTFLPPNPLDGEGLDWKLVMNENSFKKTNPYDITIQEVIWEYWNGNGWARLIFDQGYQQVFKYEEDDDVARVTISFICPEDTAPSYVNAHYNYWLRARISKVNNAYKLNAVYRSPFIEKLNISYSYKPTHTRPFELVMAEKNLALSILEFSGSKETVIFVRESEPEIAAYFCLKKPINGGPITLYFNIPESKERQGLPLKWEYLGREHGREKWLELKVSDETKMLTRSGLITFIGKTDFSRAILLGQEGYWLRALNNDSSYMGATSRQVPYIKGIYFNTVKVQQQETYPIEYFSIEPHQAYKECKLLGENLIWVEAWVEETESLSPQELQLLQEENPHQVNIELDEIGKDKKVWIRWRQIEDLIVAKGNERVFVADEYHGKIIFGDDKFGKIPPSGQGNTIRVFYRSSKGDKGNTASQEIRAFADAVPFVNRVFNVEPVLGGCSREPMEKALQRGPSIIKSQGMAVTFDDFEDLVMQADRNIVRAKCLLHQTPNGNNEIGAITIAFLPIYYNNSFSYFNSIKKNVVEKVKDAAPCVLVHSNKLYVVEVEYLQISVNMKLIIDDYNHYQTVVQQVEEKLCKFMNPISGNYHGRGWDIGQYPNREKLYNVIKMEQLIKRVEYINLDTILINHQGGRPVELSQLAQHQLCVPICGEINMDIEVETKI